MHDFCRWLRHAHTKVLPAEDVLMSLASSLWRLAAIASSAVRKCKNCLRSPRTVAKAGGCRHVWLLPEVIHDLRGASGAPALPTAVLQLSSAAWHVLHRSAKLWLTSCHALSSARLSATRQCKPLLQPKQGSR
jgi:hypothetical protein